MNKYQLTKHMKLIRYLVLFISIYVLFPIIGHAEESEVNFKVTPVFSENQVDTNKNYFDLNLPVGAKDTMGLTLSNTSSEEISIKIGTYTAFTNVNGVVEYGKKDIEKDSTLIYEIGDLIEVPEQITLAGGEEKTINISIAMPKENFEGLLAGGLRIEEVNEEEKNENKGQGVSIKNKFSYIVGVVLSNDRSKITPQLELLNVFPDQLNYRNVFSATIQNSTAVFVNQLKVKAEIRSEGKEEVLYKAENENMQMAPNSHFNYPVPLNGSVFQKGSYIATITAQSGEHNWEWKQKFTIKQESARRLNKTDVSVDTSINWWIIVAGILFIVLLILLVFFVIKNKKQNGE